MTTNACQHRWTDMRYPCPWCQPSPINMGPLPQEAPTIRQQAVLMAMQGLLASSGIDDTPNPDYMAQWAIQYADAALKAERETR